MGIELLVDGFLPIQMISSLMKHFFITDKSFSLALFVVFPF